MNKKISQSIRILFFPITMILIVTSFAGANLSDSKSIQNNIFSTADLFPPPNTRIKVVINEVYYDVDPTKGSDPDDEWIELYNWGDVDINLKNYAITDNSTNIMMINTDTTIPAKGLVLISKNRSTFDLYWNVPAGVEIIELGNWIGNGLSDIGDRVTLHSDPSAQVDSISYGTDTISLNPAIVDVAKGHSISRTPNGYDSNRASDFADLSLPTPGI